MHIANSGSISCISSYVVPWTAPGVISESRARNDSLSTTECGPKHTHTKTAFRFCLRRKSTVGKWHKTYSSLGHSRVNAHESPNGGPSIHTAGNTCQRIVVSPWNVSRSRLPAPVSMHVLPFCACFTSFILAALPLDPSNGT